MHKFNYEIGGVSCWMTKDAAERWNSADTTNDDMQSIEVYCGENRWPGDRPSMHTVFSDERFADLKRMIEDSPANRVA
jgi:hypothetical protein